MKKIIIISLVIVSAAACFPQAPTASLNDQEVIASLVAATQAAVSSQGGEPDGTVQAPDPGSPTSTGEPAATTAPADTPTLTPTPTNTLTPTATLTPTLSADDPVLSLGMPTFDDDFDGGTNFFLYEDDQASYQIEDGRMVLVARKANSYDTWSLSWADLKNFYLEATGTFGEECSGRDRYGLIFRAPDTSQGYLLYLSCSGSYRLRIWDSDEEEYTDLKDWTSSQVINAGPGSTNRLGIKAKNSKLTVYINGHQVFETNDSTFTKGRFGVVVTASDTPGFTAYLERVVYWKLP